MYILFVVIVLLVAAVYLALFPPRVGALSRPESGMPRLRKRIPRAVALIPAALGLLMLAFTSFTVIEAKNVGVQTRFGKPVDSLSAGIHLKTPVDKVTELDGTKITNRYEGDARIPVRIGDGTSAHVTTAIRWSIVPDKADEIYADYRSDDVNATLRESLVETVFTSALNQVFGQWNPIADHKVVDPNAPASVGGNFVADLDGFAAQVTESMNRRVSDTGGYVKIDFITISGIGLSKETQSRINAVQAETAKTQVALQEKATAQVKAEANDLLSASLTEEIISNNCVELLRKMVDDGAPIPVGGIGCPGADSSNLILPGGGSQKQ